MENQNDLKTLIGMAETLQIHPATLRSWAKSGMVPYYRIGKKYFFKSNEVLQESASKTKKVSESLQKLCSSHNGFCISNGYIHVKIGKHPMANKNGYVPLHRLIMQAKLGRLLKPNEIVHPKNGNTLDVRVENLELRSSLGKHNSEHRSMREDK